MIAKIPIAKCPIAKIPIGECPNAEILIAQCQIAECPIAERPIAKCLMAQLQGSPTMTTDLRLRLDWQDKHLSWDPKDFGNINVMRIGL